MPAPRVRNLTTGYKLVELRREAYKERATELAGDLWSGKISITEWRKQMQQELKDLHVTSLIIARGGDPKAVSFSEWGRLGGYIRGQYRYLDKYQKALEESAQGSLLGVVNFKSERYIANRSGMYGTNARATFWRGVTYGLLPQVPGDGATQCKCITTPTGRVLTEYGWIPMLDVQVGDLVWTHRKRWRAVVGISVKPSVPGQRQVWMIGPEGERVGCNDQHLWYTGQAWMNAPEIDLTGAECMLFGTKGNYGEETMSEVRSPVGPYCQNDTLQSMSLGMSLRQLQGFSRARMRFVWEEAQGDQAMARCGRPKKDGGWYQEEGKKAQNQVRGFGTHGMDDQRRRAGVHVLLAGGGVEKQSDLSVSLAVDQGIWPNSEGVCDPSPQRGLLGRQAGKSDLDVQHRSCPSTWENGQGKEQRAMVDMQDMRSQIPEVSETRGRPEILFAGMLPPGSALYDLTVEEDHSFVIEGFVSHNSNCGCRLDIREGDTPDTVHVYWIVDPALENCPDCIALQASWNPYVVTLPPEMIEAGDELGLSLISVLRQVLTEDMQIVHAAFASGDKMPFMAVHDHSACDHNPKERVA